MLRKVIAVGALAAGMLWSSAPPASAEIDIVQTGIGTDLYMTSSVPSLPFVQTVKFTGALTGGGLQVAVACSAVAVGPAASVTISSCYASSAAGGSANGPSISLPGPTAATAATNNVGIGRIVACMTARVQWVDGTPPTGGTTCNSVSGP